MYEIYHETGLVDPISGGYLQTKVWAYGTSAETASWPGPLLVSDTNVPTTIQWRNELWDVTQHPFTSLDGGLPVLDPTLHWAFSIHGYEDYSLESDGVPTAVHVHGVNTESRYDGNPEEFFTPGHEVTGPLFNSMESIYPNEQPAGFLWYHDQ